MRFAVERLTVAICNKSRFLLRTLREKRERERERERGRTFCIDERIELSET